MSTLSLIPSPKKLLCRNGKFKFSKSSRIQTNSCNFELARLLQEKLKDIKIATLSIEVSTLPPNCIRIVNDNESNPNFSNNNRKELNHEESYVLNITKDYILIQGKTEKGLFYGMQTLIQILHNTQTPPYLKILDFPSLDMRGVHLDLKGLMPKYENLIEIIEKLAYYKINTLLLEYEDKFLYKRHPDISSKIALNKSQITEIINVAKENNIECIPLVQSFAHVEYVLKHNRYSSLREVCDNPYQYCPTNPKTFVLYQEFCEEVIEVHKDSKYFHIGADEVSFLGICPKCSKEVKSKGKLGLYVDYLRKICDYILKQGKRPIVWDDVLSQTGHPDYINKLPKELIILNWDYFVTGVTPNRYDMYVRWNGWRTSKKWFRDENLENWLVDEDYPQAWIEEIPKRIFKIYAPYWKNKKFPLYKTSFPYIKFYKDRGFDVVGGSDMGLLGELFFQDFNHRLKNISTWAKEIKKSNGIGVISTCWTRGSSLSQPLTVFESCWYSILASGEAYWNSEKFNSNDFSKKFSQCYFGINDDSIGKAINFLSRNKEFFAMEALKILSSVEKKIKYNKTYFDYLKIAGRMIIHESFRQNVMHRNEYAINKIYYRIKKSDLLQTERANQINILKELRKDLIEVKIECRKLFCRFLENCEVDEFLESRYKHEEDLISYYLKILKR